MCISKQIEAIKNCLKHQGNNIAVAYTVSTYDSNIVSYYVTWTCGTNDTVNRKLELTVEKSKVFWIVTDYIGTTTTIIDSLRKAIREAK